MPVSKSGSTGFGNFIGTPQPAPVVYVPPPPATPVSPTIDPKIEANALYGKPMVLFAGGYARIGAPGAPIVGPYLNAGTVDFIVSFGVPVPVTGDRKIYKIYLDNELAWSSVGGGTLPGDGTFASEAFDFVFKPGTLTQTICSLETDKFPGDENAYRPQMLLEIRNLPYQRFMNITGKPVPYVAAEIGDVTDGDPFDGINLGTALERIAHSPWAGYDSSTFEAVGITDVVDAILIKDNFTIVDLCRSVTRIYRNIDLLQSDKLRIKDRGAVVSPDFVFDRDSIIGGDAAVQVFRSNATGQRRELELIAIDPDQDYTPVSSLAQIPRNPFVISAAAGKETITSPLVINASTRQALVTFAQQQEETARKTVALSVGAYGYEIEPGDLFSIPDTVTDGVDGEVFKCTQTVHRADYIVEIEGEAIWRCGLSYNPGQSFQDLYFPIYSSGSFIYTASSVDLGDEAPDRVIVVMIGMLRSSPGARTISDVTINGVTATIHEHITRDGNHPVNSPGSVTAVCASAVVPTGTSVTVAITTNGLVTAAFMSVNRLTGLASSTPHDSAEANAYGGGPSLTIDIPNNGILIASYAGVDTDYPGSFLWTGIDTVEYSEQVDGTLNGFWAAGGTQTGMGTQTARPVSISTPGIGAETLLAVSFA